MVSDQEPRYQLLDSNGNVVGTFYQKADGTLAVQDGVSESEVVFDGDTLGSGSEAVDVGSVSTDKLATNRTIQNVTASRSFNTTFTNDSESDIFVSVNAEAQADGTTIILDVLAGGVAEYAKSSPAAIDTGEENNVVFVVPAGIDYEVRAFGDSANYTLQKWTEVRP